MNKKRLFLSLSLLLAAAGLFAQSDSVPAFSAKLVIEGGIEFGGDELVEAIFTNGETQSIYAGQGGYLAVGGEFAHAQASQFRLRATLGFKYVTTAAENANVRLTRWPAHLVAYWLPTQDIRIGLGAATQFGVKLYGDGFFDDVAFDSSIGPRIEVGYRWVALTYTALRYTDEFDDSYSANAFGASLSFTLPNK